MRRLFAAAILCVPLLASAQVPGWLSCAHTQTNERLTTVRVALIEASATVAGRQYGDPRTLSGVNLTTQVLTFDKSVVPTQIIGMRLTCEWSVPSPLKVSNIVHTQYWETPIPIPAGIEPKMGVLIDEPGPGLKRATIGKK